MPPSTFPSGRRDDNAARAAAQPALRLICLPHAGGNASSFSHWNKLLRPDIELRAIQYPGRGARFCESPHQSMADLVEEVGAELLKNDDRPFAIFGHSMGALVAFETARYLRNSGRRQPAAVFFSGCDAPQVFRCDPAICEMSDEEFCAKLANYGGMQRELMESDELMSLLLPTIRADFDVLARYRYRTEPPLDVPIVILRGDQDRQVSGAAVGDWRQHTTGAFSSHEFEGDHFFIHSQTSDVVRRIAHAMDGLHRG